MMPNIDPVLRDGLVEGLKRAGIYAGDPEFVRFSTYQLVSKPCIFVAWHREDGPIGIRVPDALAGYMWLPMKEVETR